MSNEQKKLIEISPAIHEPDAHSYRVRAGLAPALEAMSAASPALEATSAASPALEAASAPSPVLETVFVANAPTCELDVEGAGGHCITCSDEAVTVQVLQIDSETGIAFVTVQNKTEEVDITLVEDVVPGDWLLVHGGVAIANVDNHSPNDAGEASDA